MTEGFDSLMAQVKRKGLKGARIGVDAADGEVRGAGWMPPAGIFWEPAKGAAGVLAGLGDAGRVRGRA